MRMMLASILKLSNQASCDLEMAETNSDSALRRMLRNEDDPSPRHSYWQGVTVGASAMIVLHWSFGQSLWITGIVLVGFVLLVRRQAHQLEDDNSAKKD